MIEWAQRIVMAQNREIERAVEEALQTGEHGVLVVRRDITATVTVSPHVPYGTIYEMTPDGYAEWAGRGYPQYKAEEDAA